MILFRARRSNRGAIKLMERPLMQRLAVGGEVSMKEVRDFLLSLLNEYETSSLCSDCPESDTAYKELACCHDCPNLDPGVGCLQRNTACLIWACGALERYLRSKRVYGEFNAVRSIFGRLDSWRGSYRIPDHILIRLEKCMWTSAGIQAVTIYGRPGNIWEESWDYGDEEKAREKQRAFITKLKEKRA